MINSLHQGVINSKLNRRGNKVNNKKKQEDAISGH